MTVSDFETRLVALFDEADDLRGSDTIWYSPIETLYEAILFLHNACVVDALVLHDAYLADAAYEADHEC